METLRIIGTSHVASQSLEEVRQAVDEFKPDIIALELDAGRFNALINEDVKGRGLSIRAVGLKGYLFFIIGGWLQRKLGKELGIVPGAEMKLAIKLAKERNLRIALIDRDIHITLRRFSEAVGWRERFRFIGDFVRGLVNGKRELKALGLEGLDLRKVPDEDLIQRLMMRIKERYPGTYAALVEERNVIMATRLAQILATQKDKKILAILGAGHKRGVEEELERLTAPVLAIAG